MVITNYTKVFFIRIVLNIGFQKSNEVLKLENNRGKRYFYNLCRSTCFCVYFYIVFLSRTCHSFTYENCKKNYKSKVEF